MKKILGAALVALVALVAAGSANAALIMRTYTVTGDVSGAPFTPSLVTLAFTLTYDPTINVTDGVVNAYSTSSSYASFQTAAPGYTNFANYALLLGTKDRGLANTGIGNVNGVTPAIEDYYLVLKVDSLGYVAATDPSNSLTISAAGQIRRATIASISVDPPAAVPEPATWAMFIGGFGLIGTAMRRRKRVSATFA